MAVKCHDFANALHSQACLCTGWWENSKVSNGLDCYSPTKFYFTFVYIPLQKLFLTITLALGYKPYMCLCICIVVCLLQNTALSSSTREFE